MNPNLIILKKGHLKFFSERRTTRENFKLDMTVTYILVLLFIGVLGIYYVWTLNVNATKGYNIRQLEIEKKNLSVEKELLEVKMAELESLDTIMKSDYVDYMEKTESPEYLVIKDNGGYAFNYQETN
ncbi:MAG: hypothetical protein PHG82_03630 [Candidatus Gracilibacteria bacterium]|nr:hypothetical protein [Candidatus Gracilibacteria bacterium]